MFKLNGKDIEFKEKYTLLNLLEDNNFKNDFVVIEIDGEIIPKNSYETYFVKNGENIEVVTFVGGG